MKRAGGGGGRRRLFVIGPWGAVEGRREWRRLSTVGRRGEEGKWDRGRDCSGGMKGRREGRNSPGEEKIVLGSGGGGGGVDEGGKKEEDLLCTLRHSVRWVELIAATTHSREAIYRRREIGDTPLELWLLSIKGKTTHPCGVHPSPDEEKKSA